VFLVTEPNDRDIVSVMPELDFTLAFDSPDEDGWIVARVLEVPGR
jgi:hypothetical protein